MNKNDSDIPWYVVALPCAVAIVLILAILSPSCTIRIHFTSTPIEATK